MTTTISKQTSTESLHARIPQGIREEIDNIAVGIGRSRNWVFNEALKQYVELQQWHVELIEERLAEAKNKSATFIPHNEVMERQEKEA